MVNKVDKFWIGWCGAGADHYEPLVSEPAPLVPQDKAAFFL